MYVCMYMFYESSPSLTFRQKRLKQIKARSMDPVSWNTLFVNTNSANESAAKGKGMKKADMLGISGLKGVGDDEGYRCSTFFFFINILFFFYFYFYFFFFFYLINILC
jgi:hypothetical protein